MAEFNIADEDHTLLDNWCALIGAPALLLNVPEHGNVGEAELINHLASAVYDKNVHCGLHRHDSRQRHFASRNFPYGGSESDYARFKDELEDSAEVTNEFYGIDHIDLTQWVGKDPSRGPWQTLVHHVQSHSTVDFVFSARCAKDAQALKLVDLLRSTCGVPVETVNLLAPTPTMLAGAVLGAMEMSPGFDCLDAWFADLGRTGVELNYVLAHSLSAKARILGIDLSVEDEAERFLAAGYGDAVTGLYEKKRLGF